MGLNYSLGITFKNEKDADLCCSEFRNLKIYLPNGKEVRLFPYVSGHADNDILKDKLYVLSVSVNGLGNVGIDLSLFDNQNFYAIRDFFNQYIKSLILDFEFAHFELEAADYLMCAKDMIDDISALIKNTCEGDESFQKITGIDRYNFLSKRYIDGIVISSKNYFKLERAKSEFQIFKENYYWLPVKEFKFSK